MYFNFNQITSDLSDLWMGSDPRVHYIISETI